MVSSETPTPSFTDQYGSVYRLIEPGVFTMGDDTGRGHPNEQPASEVVIDQPFFLAERPVTQAQWTDVMGSNPSKFQDGWSAGLRPVEQVSHEDIVQFIERLNRRSEGNSYLGLLGEWRLPSEAEWEYAARAGTSGRWWFGDKDVELDEHGWHAGNSGGTTREVGLKKPNPWGLYDMNGLVNEWCGDHWAKTYEGGRTQHPHVRHGSNQYVVRGGAWFTESDSTRNRARSFAAEDKISDGLGFRLVWSPHDEQPMVDQGASPTSGFQS